MQRKVAGRLLIVLLTAIMIAMLLPMAGVGDDIYADPSSKTIISAKALLPSITKTAVQDFEVVTTSDVNLAGFRKQRHERR